MVELLDGYTNQVVARFDGRNPPRDIVNISADFVILYFYSDRTNEAQGFSMIYQGRDHNIIMKICNPACRSYSWKMWENRVLLFFL